MIYPVTMYSGRCDCCGCEIRLGGGEFTAYTDKGYVEEEMANSDWKIGDGKEVHSGEHYCFDCWYYDDNDFFCINESRRDIHKPKQNNK
jgi:hypothetical protein